MWLECHSWVCCCVCQSQRHVMALQGSKPSRVVGPSGPGVRLAAGGRLTRDTLERGVEAENLKCTFMDAATEFWWPKHTGTPKWVENEDLGKSALKWYLIGQLLMGKSWTCWATWLSRDDSWCEDVLNIAKPNTGWWFGRHFLFSH